MFGKESVQDNETCGNLKQVGSQLAIEFFWNKLIKAPNNLNISSPQTLRHKKSFHKLPEDKNIIKSGWLYKRRDIISGWRCRYFCVYPGRLEYFIDSNDVVPRGVVPLLGAEVTGPRKCNVNGAPDHWCLL